eukprot:5473044-Prymnesium_polylepis.1
MRTSPLARRHCARTARHGARSHCRPMGKHDAATCSRDSSATICSRGHGRAGGEIVWSTARGSR